MASIHGLQATFALGGPRRRSHVLLSPAKTIVLRPTSHIFRGRVYSSSSVASCIPPEGSSNGKARTGSSKAAAGLQALAVAAACAVGASVCLSRAAAKPSIFPSLKLDTKTTETVPAPATAGEECRTSRAGKTPLLPSEIIFGRKVPGTECEDSCKKLVDHAFAILPLNDQLLLLDQISMGKIRDHEIGDHEINEIQIALVQIYLAMHEYLKAKEVSQSMKDNDIRIYLLQAVVHVMLAAEKMLEQPTILETDKEIKDLVDSAKKLWEKIEKDLLREPNTNGQSQSWARAIRAPVQLPKLPKARNYQGP